MLPVYYRRFTPVAAVRLPPSGEDAAHVLQFLDATMGEDHPFELEEDGSLEIHEGEYAKPGDWLVATDQGGLPAIYPDELFAAAFVTAAEYGPEYKLSSPLPPGMPLPPVVFASLEVLASAETWPTKDHVMLINYLIELASSQIPPGYTALRTADLDRLDLMAYEQLRAIFPTLPPRSSLITLSGDIGAARNGK